MHTFTNRTNSINLAPIPTVPLLSEVSTISADSREQLKMLLADIRIAIEKCHGLGQIKTEVKKQMCHLLLHLESSINEPHLGAEILPNAPLLATFRANANNLLMLHTGPSSLETQLLCILDTVEGKSNPNLKGLRLLAPYVVASTPYQTRPCRLISPISPISGSIYCPKKEKGFVVFTKISSLLDLLNFMSGGLCKLLRDTLRITLKSLHGSIIVAR